MPSHARRRLMGRAAHLVVERDPVAVNMRSPGLGVLWHVLGHDPHA